MEFKLELSSLNVRGKLSSCVNIGGGKSNDLVTNILI